LPCIAAREFTFRENLHDRFSQASFQNGSCVDIDVGSGNGIVTGIVTGIVNGHVKDFGNGIANGIVNVIVNFNVNVNGIDSGNDIINDNFSGTDIDNGNGRKTFTFVARRARVPSCRMASLCFGRRRQHNPRHPHGIIRGFCDTGPPQLYSFEQQCKTADGFWSCFCCCCWIIACW
jgi:hypothetical protein